MVNRPKPVTPDNNTGDQQSMEKLKQSAGYIIGAIVLVLLGYFGWNYMQNSGNKADTVAAEKFNAIEQQNESLQLAQDPTAIDSEANKALNDSIDNLVAEHGSTIYAWQALMIKARNAVDANQHDVALDALKKAMDIELNDAGLHALTQLRYATVLLANGDVDEAKEYASLDVPTEFEGSQQEILGDIYVEKNDMKSAERAYSNAWSILSKRSEERPILRLKLESLGVNPDPIEPLPEAVDQSALAQQNEQVAEQNSDAQSQAELEAAVEAAAAMLENGEATEETEPATE